jgi:hypothetical protein
MDAACGVPVAPVWNKSLQTAAQRLDAAGPFFFTFGLREPRGSVRLAFGGRFVRASRFSFLRSALSATFRVFMTFLLDSTMHNQRS